VCGSGGTGRHTICAYHFRNSIQTYDNEPIIFRLDHFQQRPSERPVDASKPRMQAVGAKSGAVPWWRPLRWRPLRTYCGALMGSSCGARFSWSGWSLVFRVVFFLWGRGMWFPRVAIDACGSRQRRSRRSATSTTARPLPSLNERRFRSFFRIAVNSWKHGFWRIGSLFGSHC
jgi:hypothetical protein